jgi:TrmH family RNA methyltransferase
MRALHTEVPSASPGDSLARFHVVLVEPGVSRNVGSVARAMRNLGFTHLHLVAPPRYREEDALQTACWAEDLVRGAQVHATLHEALADTQQVVGFSARHGRQRPKHVALDEWAGTLTATPAVETALVFGPEDTGLRQEHLSHCRWLIRIRSRADNPAFNLSHAVLLGLYEISRAVGATEAVPARTAASPAGRTFYELERIVDEVLLRCRFYHDGTPEPLPQLIKHLLRRIEPDGREMQVLLGLFSKINRTLSGEVPVRHLPQDRDA